MNKNPLVAFILTVVGGFLELYSYVCLNKVFATTITGNIVLSSINLINRNYFDIPKYIFPIISFSLAIILVEKIRKFLINYKIKWENYILLSEIVVFIFIPFINNSIISVSLIALVSGMQIHSFSFINNSRYASTMCTGNVRNLMEALVNKDKIKIKDYAIVILGFLVGVLLADIFIDLYYQFSIYICIALILIVLFLINTRRKNEIIR